MVEFSKTAPETPSSSPEQPPEELYERKYSVTQRFYKLLTAPSKAMRDIALAPDYEGVLVVIVLNLVLMSVVAGILLQKIQFSGPHAETASQLFSTILVAASFILVIYIPAKWAIKSLLVKHACDNGSGWEFKTAASITGYAYITDIIMGILEIFILWFLLPTLHFDTGADWEALRQIVNDYEAQITWLRLLYTLPVSIFGLLWKSYLGGLGTHFGTKEKCSLRMGIAVFTGLSLIGFLISEII